MRQESTGGMGTENGTQEVNQKGQKLNGTQEVKGVQNQKNVGVTDLQSKVV